MIADGLYINTLSQGHGDIKTLCPKCSPTRKHSTDPCLSINVDTGQFKCHNCGWSGITDDKKGNPYSKQIKVFNIPKYKDDSQISSPALEFFKSRSIPEEVLQRNKITAGRVIHFPYFRDRSAVNIKHRFFQDGKKDFRLEKGAELIFYGYDDINNDMTIIVEGEMDKLAMEVAGYLNVISPPSGTKGASKSTTMSYMDTAKERLEMVKEVVMAGDMDAAGEDTIAELSRRIGREKCSRVLWPKGCKDANDVLMQYGIDKIRECIKKRKMYPIAGLYAVDDFREETKALQISGLSRGISTGWATLDSHYTVMPGQWTVVTGSPGTGKSEFLDALIVNLIKTQGWKFAICSMENLPVETHLSKLLEKFTGMPFFDGPNKPLTQNDIDDGLDVLQNHIKFILPEEGGFTVPGILKLAIAAVKRFGVNGLVIDPWNELEHNFSMNETKYIGDSLTKLRRFARLMNVHVWIVAHPTKLRKDDDGKYPVPTLYDIAGSANWYNKADCGISLWRDCADNSIPVQVHIQKIRFQKQVGKPGMVEMIYNPINGQYRDIY